MAGTVTVGVVFHWTCVTDLSGLSTYGLKALITLFMGYLKSAECTFDN